MARYNSVNSTSSVAQGSTISTPYSGLLTTITTGSGSVALPNPTLYTGSVQTFYNATATAVTLTTPSGNITGPGTGGTNSLTLPIGSIITLVSDGTNYIAQAWLGGVVSATAITASGTITANSTVTFNPSNANISIQPSGTGTVTINPAVAGTMDNVAVGATTATTGRFTTVTSNNSGFRVSGYNAFSATGSGAMGIIGHNAIADQAATNRVLQQNNNYYGHFIRMYYNDGIAFHTRTALGTAGDVLYDLATPANQVADVAERVRITPAGYVGIGISNPTTPLHVTNISYQNAALTYGPASSTSTYSSLRGRVDGTYGWELDQFGSTYVAGDYAQPNGTALVNVLSGPLILGTSNTHRLTIVAGGSVGIGSLTPQTKLDVNGSIVTRGDIFFSSLGTNTLTTPPDNVNWHHLGYAGGANYHVTGSATGDLTIGAIPGSNIVFGTVATGQPVPLQRLTITPAGGVTVANRLTTTDLTISNGYIYNGNGTNQFRMAIFSLSTYGGNQYVHMKTDQKTNNSNMYRFEYTGYDYGSAQVLAGAWVGYLYSASDSAISLGIANWGNRAFANSVYRSSDGYLVLVADTASYYNSFTIHYQSGATGQFSPTITAYSQQTGTGSVY
jgi:hypothetical protein